MGYYQQNQDLLCQDKSNGLSYNQVLDIADVEESSGDPVVLDEPVTLEEAKNFCKIDVDEDDTLISSLITAARLMCEEFTNIGFVQRQIVVVLNNGNGGAFLPLGPIGSITEFSDKDTVITDYVLSGSNWKQILTPRSERMTITYLAGYEVLPENLKAGLLNTIMYLYDNRSQGKESIGPIAKTILNPIRRVW